MGDRRAVLQAVKAGDIIHGEGINGKGQRQGSFICLVLSVTETHISARTVTHQIPLRFDKEHGNAFVEEYGFTVNLDSVAPLPKDVHDAFIQLDKRYRTSTDPDAAKLRPEEIRAVLFVGRHYRENPID